jgi:hypothetical protein
MKKRTRIKNQCRQGDVLVNRIPAVPKDAAPKDPDPRGVVLAEGEVTGHAHRIADPGVCSLRQEGGHDIVTIDVSGLLIHEEHGAHEISGGVFESRIQREYAWSSEAEAMSRAVAD